MTGMTPERLAAIEDRLPDMIRPGTTEHDTLNLLDEVRRLREAIQSQIDAAYSEWLEDGDADAAHRADHWRSLLNPTEGEDHE